MKCFSFVILLAMFFISCNGGDYELELDDTYSLVKLDTDHHSIINREKNFYNFVKIGVQLETCLEQHSQQDCQGLGGSTIVEPNVLMVGVGEEYIFGLKKHIDNDYIDPDLLQGLIPLQLDGYFIINKGMATVETGLAEAEFLKRLDDLGIKKSLKEIDDRKNMIKALPQMFINEKFGY